MTDPNSVSFHQVLPDLWRAVRQKKWLIAVIVSFSTGLSVAYAVLAPQWFRADVVMVSASRSETAGRLSQLGGLASLAGVSLGNSGAGESVAVLKSKIFARDFIIEHKLQEVLLPEFVKTGESLDSREAVQLFDSHVRSVSEDKKAGTITLTIEWRDPDLAAAWANEYVRSVNKRLQAQALAEARRNVDFLQREIANTDVVQLRQSLGSVLESEMQKLMLARGNESFAFRIVDDAVPPMERSRPNRAAVILLGTLFGLFLASVAAFWPQIVGRREVIG